MAREARFDPHRLDVAAMARTGAAAEGELPLESLRRLAELRPAGIEAAGSSGVVWRVRGERAALGEAGLQDALELACDATVTLQCQRCLQPLAVPLRVERRLFFVDGEDAAAALDAESEDDVLARPAALDLPALIEDELLLALPIVPRHAQCPEPLPWPKPAAASGAAAGAAGEAHPFAALAALKRGGLPH